MANIRLVHKGSGYLTIWRSTKMADVLKEAGEKVAANANAGYSGEYFKYYGKAGNNTQLGFVSSTGPSGNYYEQRDGALSKAVHA